MLAALKEISHTVSLPQHQTPVRVPSIPLSLGSSRKHGSPSSPGTSDQHQNGLLHPEAGSGREARRWRLASQPAGDAAPRRLGGGKHMNRSCGQEGYQVHLYAPRAQLLHLNPSHGNCRLQFQPVSERENRSCSRAPSATAPDSSQHSPSPVSTHFFSNSSFLSKLLLDVS